ncbi:unnamed protein product [Ceutorhynchus assimilis]|uniref:Chitin-binding type-2 domain-containing protein n=1 Tax=Ceutorhynchus assimilis TaxID=467358 RepID=A0A9N9QRY7_9CUCU|nr:unnamed protein product [Ceutorhynchus assimilis]
MSKIYFLVSTLVVLVLATCVLAQDVSQKTPNCPENCKPTLFFPDYNCSYFWICRNGVAEKHNCAPFEWDTSQNTCVPPSLSNCVDGKGWNSTDLICPVMTTPSTTTSTTKPTTTTKKTTTATKSTTITKSTSTTSAGTTIASNPPNCSSDCPYNIYLPHSNCSLFWQCANGIATLLECPCDLHYNPEANVCDWPWNFEHDVPCRDWTWDDLECVPPESTTYVSTLEPIDPPDCPEDCPHNIYVGDKTSCQYFYQCVNGRAYRKKCPEGLVFNSVSKTCNIGGCNEYGWTWEDLICPVYTTEKPCCETSTENPLAPLCQKGCRETIYLADYDCHYYWVCFDGIATKMACAADLHWDSKEKVCSYEKDAHCDKMGWSEDELICPTTISTSTNRPETTGTTPKPQKCEPGVVFYPNPKDCRTYWECSNGAAHLMPCPAGLEWSTEENRCDWPSVANCVQIE